MTPLRDLDARLTTMDFGDGLKLQYLIFDCPNPRCARGHTQGMPYSDAPDHEIARPAPLGIQPGVILLWQRVSGSTIDDITMSPSFVVQSCDGLHGHVRNGQWVPC